VRRIWFITGSYSGKGLIGDRTGEAMFIQICLSIKYYCSGRRVTLFALTGYLPIICLKGTEYESQRHALLPYGQNQAENIPT
jgi:hypothetical protein